MTTHSPTSAPSTRDRLVFAGLLAVFFTGIGWFMPGHAGSLFGMASFIAIATLIALAFADDAPRSRMSLGFAPAVILAGLASLSLALPVDTSRGIASSSGAALGITLAAMAAWSEPMGASLYRAWMAAFRPVGWSVSFLLLACVYYVILTPTGLLMRALGRDPMERTIDRSATSYWVRRKPVTDPRRYFRQS